MRGTPCDALCAHVIDEGCGWSHSREEEQGNGMVCFGQSSDMYSQRYKRCMLTQPSAAGCGTRPLRDTGNRQLIRAVLVHQRATV